jgi:DNA-binding response OmpR family regulator
MSIETKPLNVLVVEDDEGDAFLIKFYLGESVNYKFTFNHAKDMQSAHQLMTEQTFDIILMDLNLPDSNGLDTIKSFIETYPNSLVIVLTGLIDEKTGLEAVKVGAQDYLVKGKFDSKLLVSSIIFAFERFSLTSKIKKVGEVANLGEQRFEMLQRIHFTGYLEYSIETDKLFLSKLLRELSPLDLPEEILLEPFLLSYAEKSNELGEYVKLLKATSDQRGEFEFVSFVSNKKIKFAWIKENNKIFGAISYPPDLEVNA